MTEVDAQMAALYGALAQDLKEKADALPADKQLWVAIAGPPGSGKTTLGTRVVQQLQALNVACVLLSMDGFHYYRSELRAMPDPDEAFRRRGAHWTFNADKLLQKLSTAREAASGTFPTFDHCEGDPVEDGAVVAPKHRVIIMEGNYLLLQGVPPWNEASRYFDEKWFLQCEAQLCADRLVRRHILTGLTPEVAKARVAGNDAPNGQLIVDNCDPKAVDKIIQSV